jgi:hypothetical protein
MRGNPTVCYFYSRKQLGNQSIPYNKGLLERKKDMSESSADWSAALKRQRQMSKSSPTLRGMVHAERAPRAVEDDVIPRLPCTPQDRINASSLNPALNRKGR